MKCKLSVALVLLSSFLMAQEQLQTLHPPTSPAAGVLGIQPQAILTPKSENILELGMYQNIGTSQAGFGLPTDFALEFTPYWSKDHGLSLDEYLFPNRKVIDQFIRNSSFSVATTQNFVLGDSSNTNGIGFGYRCGFFFGAKEDEQLILDFRQTLDANKRFKSKTNALFAYVKADAKTFVLVDTIDKKIAFAANEFTEALTKKDSTLLIARIKRGVKAAIGDTLRKENYEAFSTAISGSLGDGEVFKTFENYILDRRGFSIDVAYATLLNFPSSNFAQSYVPMQSVWLTPGYRFGGGASFLNIDGVLRYQWYDVGYYKSFFPQSNIFQNNIDVGLALAGSWPRFSIQFELVSRNSSTKQIIGSDAYGNTVYETSSSRDLQYMGTFNFTASKTISLSYTLGNRFEAVMNPENTLVSTLSINFRFGTPKKEGV